jgi:hypothetical protein
MDKTEPRESRNKRGTGSEGRRERWEAGIDAASKRSTMA